MTIFRSKNNYFDDEFKILFFSYFCLSQDPHFVGVPKSVDDLIHQGYIRWQHTSDFVDSSFYNLCLPQLKYLDD